MHSKFNTVGRLLFLVTLLSGLLSPTIPVLAVQPPEPYQVYYFPAHPSSAPVAADPSQKPVAAAAGSGNQAAPSAVTAAGMDDRDNTDPTGWAVYEHQNITQVVNTATANSYRVVDLFVESAASPYQLTATYVANTGSYAKSWWILVDVTPATLLSFATGNNARITVLKAFDDPSPGGTVKFFAVLISNTGADAKAWWFYEGKTVAEVSALWQANSARLVQVNSYVKNATKYYDVVMVDNTGANNRGWWWYVNATPGQISTNLSTNNARLVDMDIDSATGNYNVIMNSCSSGCPMWWWYYGISTSNLLNIAFQDGARIIDANSVSGCGDRCWSFVLINNSNAITSRVGELLRSKTDGVSGLYLKQVGGPVLANLNDGTVFEPASAIKAVTHLYTWQKIQAGVITQSTAINQFQGPPPGSSCPTNTVIGTEQVNLVDQEMMWHSDNTRTRELNDFFGATNINLWASGIGMTHTAINHVVGCGGPIPNQTTLDDLAVLYEGVANGALLNATYRPLFWGNMAGKGQFNVEGYDWTSLYSTDIPTILRQEAPAWVPTASLTEYRNKMGLAYKAGNYNLCTSLACTSLIYDIAIAGWAQIPFCDGGGARQFVFGVFINNATNQTAAGAAFTATKADLLREQLHAGLATCFKSSMYLPKVTR